MIYYSIIMYIIIKYLNCIYILLLYCFLSSCWGAVLQSVKRAKLLCARRHHNVQKKQPCPLSKTHSESVKIYCMIYEMVNKCRGGSASSSIQGSAWRRAAKDVQDRLKVFIDSPSHPISFQVEKTLSWTEAQGLASRAERERRKRKKTRQGWRESRGESLSATTHSR